MGSKALTFKPQQQTPSNRTPVTATVDSSSKGHISLSLRVPSSHLLIHHFTVTTSSNTAAGATRTRTSARPSSAIPFSRSDSRVSLEPRSVGDSFFAFFFSLMCPSHVHTIDLILHNLLVGIHARGHNQASQVGRSHPLLPLVALSLPSDRSVMMRLKWRVNTSTNFIHLCCVKWTIEFSTRSSMMLSLCIIS